MFVFSLGADEPVRAIGADPLDAERDTIALLEALGAARTPPERVLIVGSPSARDARADAIEAALTRAGIAVAPEWRMIAGDPGDLRRIADALDPVLGPSDQVIVQVVTAARAPEAALASEIVTRPGSESLVDALAAWRAAPVERAEPIYRQRVFAHACARMRERAAGAAGARLLFVPVGTQPYAPILAGLATRTDAVVLLHTAFTRPHAEQVRDALRSDRAEVLLAEIGDGTEPAPIASAVLREVAARGVLRPLDVMVDVTGGRKATSAVLGALAAVQGYRQAYVEGTPDRVHRAFFIDERVVELPSVRVLVGSDERQVAFALLERGEVAAARERLTTPSALGLSAPLTERLLPLLDALVDEPDAVGPALDQLVGLLPDDAIAPLRAWHDAGGALAGALAAFVDALRVDGLVEG